MPTQEKNARIDELEALLSRAVVSIVADYRGLSVQEISNLRGQLRPIGAEFHVAKNTLARIAAQRVGIQGADALLAGPTAILTATDDVAQPSRVLRDFARTARTFSVRGGFLGKSVIGADEVTRLADLPGRDQLRAQLAGNIQGPLAGLVGVFSSALSGLVYTLDERARQQTGDAAA